MNDIIIHGGPGSGRYPWGSGERPYQRLEKPKGFIARRKYEKQKKQEEINQKQKKLLEKKEKILRSGTATQIAQLRGMLTNEELSRVCSRLDYERKIASYSKSEIETARDKVERFSKNLGTLNKLGNVAIDSYNLIASVANIKAEKKWPLIKKSGGGDNQQKQDQKNKK